MMVVSHNKQPGFTIVELLIVIVVIGILAAIVIVAYNGVTGRANDETVKSNLDNISKQMEMYQSAAGRYPENDTELYGISGGIKVNKSAYDSTAMFNVLVCLMSGGGGYAVMGQSKTGNRFYINSTNPYPMSTTITGYSGLCGTLGASGLPYWLYSSEVWNSNVKG